MPREHNSADEGPRETENPLGNSAADDFFVKMNRQFRRPRPSDEAVAAALQAIQAMAGDVVSGGAASAAEEPFPVAAESCPKCGGVNAESNRFCGFCGALVERGQQPSAQPLSASSPDSKSTSMTTTPGQHIYHHHYHHHYFSTSGARPGIAPTATASESVERVITPDNGAAAEVRLRKLLEEWILECKSKAFARLAALYCADALLVRPDAPLLCGRAAIEQYLATSLGAGQAEVQLELVQTRVLTGVACLSGVTRFFSARATRSQQERSGKFLMLARYESGTWRILADVWCMNGDPFAVADESFQASERISTPSAAPRNRFRYSR